MSNEKNGFFIVREIPKSIPSKEFRSSNFSNAKRSAKRSMAIEDSTMLVESLDGQRLSVLENGEWFDYELRQAD